jgi:hypothetical protein
MTFGNMARRGIGALLTTTICIVSTFAQATPEETLTVNPGFREKRVNGRSERIRTSDLTVPNFEARKNVSFCLCESCSHRGISSILHSLPYFTIGYRLCTENSVHKLATFQGGPLMSAFVMSAS